LSRAQTVESRLRAFSIWYKPPKGVCKYIFKKNLLIKVKPQNEENIRKTREDEEGGRRAQQSKPRRAQKKWRRAGEFIALERNPILGA
jgi:hypothetical protein